MAFRRITLSLVAALSTTLTAACSNDSNSPVAPSSSPSLTSRGADSTGSAGAASSSASRVRVIIALTGTPSFAAAKGKAKWQQDGNKREVEVEIENVRAGTTVSFFVGGTQYGTAQVVDAFGKAGIELSTQLGQTVPVSVAGASVQVRNSAGATIASGSF